MRSASLMLCGALLAAGPVSAMAMRAHDFIDADQRVPVTLPSDSITTALSMEPALDTAAVLTPAPEQPLTAPQPPRAALPPPAASAVPEPSGWVLMVLGGLLLFLMPHKKDGDGFAIHVESR
jgi:hypothetical protein